MTQDRCNSLFQIFPLSICRRRSVPFFSVLIYTIYDVKGLFKIWCQVKNIFLGIDNSVFHLLSSYHKDLIPVK